MGVAESIKHSRGKAIKDNVFKNIAKHKLIASLILKATIKEFAGMEIIDIARCIKDTRKRDSDDAEVVLNDEIDLKATEDGTGSEKVIRADLIFDIDLPGEGTAEIVLARTVNLEMQGNTKNLGYDIKQRAIYYMASLLRDTVAWGDSKYAGIHKVYLVWLCNEGISMEKWESVGEQYKHRIGMRVCYDNEPNFAGYDKGCDLMEVVMIELPKMVNNLSEAEEALISLLFGYEDTCDRISNLIPISLNELSNVGKEVRDMVDWRAETEREVQEALAEALAERDAEHKKEVQEALAERDAEYKKKLEDIKRKANDDREKLEKELNRYRELLAARS